MLILSDVTALARLDEMRVELVAVASHELQTPLTTLRMTLLLLEERASRFEAGGRELVTTALHGAPQLSGIVTETTVRPSCHDQGVTLELIVGHDVAETIAGDRTRLTTVLVNLLTNALNYSPPGATVVVDATSGGTGSAPVVRLTVADSGLGVPTEYRERVFGKFFRVEYERTASDEGVRGSGIGLYVAREIFEAHGGSLACVQSLSDCGARFLLRLPAGKDEEPSSRP